MQTTISSALSAAVLLGATAAAAQSFPCASVAPEVRESVRAAGACRDVVPGDAAPKDSDSASTVTVTLSDGTVVRVPSEISASITDGRGRATVNQAARRSSASTQSVSSASEKSTSAPQKLDVPPVNSSSDAGAADANPITASATTATAPSASALATDAAPAVTTAPVAAPVPTSELKVPVEPRGPSSSSTSDNGAALIPGLALLGLSVGVLLMGHWLLHRPRAAGNSSFVTMIQQHQQPVDVAIGDASETEAPPDIRFTARRDPGETTIELAPLPAADEFALATPSGHPA